MARNPENNSRGGRTGFFVAHAVCCGGILLFATGAMGGIAAWFSDAGWIWLAGGSAITAAYLIRRRLNASPDRTTQMSERKT
jgi:hypothetical protein